jgi:hypothetical protein
LDGLRPIGTGQSVKESCIFVENSCKKSFRAKRRLPLSKHIFVLLINEPDTSQAKYETHYQALRVVENKPRKVSELKILEDVSDTMESVFHKNEYNIEMEFVNYSFLTWYVGGDLKNYCKRCRISGPHDKATENNNLFHKFKVNGDPCRHLFDKLNLSVFSETNTRTRNKVVIKNLLQEATAVLFETLSAPGRQSYPNKKQQNVDVSKDRICVEFDYFVVTLLLSMSDAIQTNCSIKPFMNNKHPPKIIGLTANGHNLSAPSGLWAIDDSLHILFDNEELKIYCRSVQRNQVKCDRNRGSQKARESSHIKNFQNC